MVQLKSFQAYLACFTPGVGFDLFFRPVSANLAQEGIIAHWVSLPEHVASAHRAEGRFHSSNKGGSE
jgi:hypothetical protein